MSTRVHTPADPIDAFNGLGDTVLTARPDSEYRRAAERLAERQAAGLPPEGARPTPQPEAPTEPPLPPYNVARIRFGRKLGELRDLMASIEKAVSRGPFRLGAGGMQYRDPAHETYISQLEGVREELESMEAIACDQHAIQVWAAAQGTR